MNIDRGRFDPASPDRAVVLAAGLAAPLADPLADPLVGPSADDVLRSSAGWLELALPLWHRRWWLLLATLLGAALAFGASLLQPLRFSGVASFVVQPQLRPSQAVAAGALPALAGLVGGAGASPVDLHVTILRSQTVSDRIIDRFDLQRSWGLAWRVQAQQRLSRRVSFGVGRRDGLVQIQVEDENPQRAAAIANEYVQELRNTLRSFALQEARARRQFYDAQLLRARADLAAAQQQLQGSGFDRAALRAQPSAAAERYSRLSAELGAAELRLAATRRVRADGSAEVQQQQGEVAGLRAQLAGIELPRDDSAGAASGYVSRLRDFRQAEALAESIARQAEAARVDEAGDAVPLQVLDSAKLPEWPSSPRPPLWAAVGALAALLAAAAWVLLRHRLALARLDPAHQQRLALLRSVLPGRR